MKVDNFHCRFCGHELKYGFADLGMSPLANEYLTENDLECGQTFYPLKVQVCSNCYLTQAAMYQKPEKIFGDYKYFSSYSSNWLAHCKAYVDMITTKLSLGKQSQVLEVACNDGYLLQYFKPYNIPVKGIEPAENVAIIAREKGIDVECSFFSDETARNLVEREGKYHLIIGNNVLAHVPDINHFVEGLAIALDENGTITMEFPHLLRLIEECQFDTIYHEHFYYLSLLTVNQIFQAHGLRIYDVEKLPTHGGSLRIYATHKGNHILCTQESVLELLKQEREFGLENIYTYMEFQTKIQKIKIDTLHLLSDLKNKGKTIAAFGAAAKGNTFLNYCGIKRDMIDFVIDSNPHKQGLYLPGSLIPIVSIDALREKQPDYLLILPWNLKSEILNVADFTKEWGCKFITCIPNVQVLD